MLWSLTADLLTAPGSLLAVATVLAAILVVALFADRLTAARRTPVPVRAVALRERARLDAAIGVAYHLVLMLGGGAAAIVVATAALRLLLLALTIRQVRAERARAALAPRLAELRERYG